MKTKKKALKLTVTFLPHMAAQIAKRAKLRKITMERAVEELVYDAVLSDECLKVIVEVMGKIFHGKVEESQGVIIRLKDGEHIAFGALGNGDPVFGRLTVLKLKK